MPAPAGTPILPASVANNRRLLFEGVAIGVLYGVVLRIAVGSNFVSHWFESHNMIGISAIMTWTFVIGGPFLIGFLCISRASKIAPIPLTVSLFAPWLSVLLMLAALALLAFEGAICVIMAVPIALILSSLGGLTAKLIFSRTSISTRTLSCLAVIPFVIAPLEAQLAAPMQTRTVASQIRIHASADTVWHNIERVPAISPSELKTNWTHRIGFPRPTEATLSYEGVGGVRQASFEHGLMFIETVNVWQLNHRLAFSIKADTVHIPTTTLDEHVTIGGRYFDVLDGEYVLEPLADGDTLLHLTSHQRLATDFNSYAGLWTDAVMQNLQTSILEVIQHRCEHA